MQPASLDVRMIATTVRVAGRDQPLLSQRLIDAPLAPVRDLRLLALAPPQPVFTVPVLRNVPHVCQARYGLVEGLKSSGSSLGHPFDGGGISRHFGTGSNMIESKDANPAFS